MRKAGHGIAAILAKVRKESKRRATVVMARAMGRERRFAAYDRGEDTFVFERVPWRELTSNASVLVVEKRDLRSGASGHVMTFTTGNHAVAALPLLQGSMWNLSRVPPARRSDVMAGAILCANIVDGKLELSQRDVSCARLTAFDKWLIGSMGFGLGDVVMAERNDETLEHYRRLGQEWRVKPLAWTEQEMSAALSASRKRISTTLRYYHGTRGVHFLTYPEFHRFATAAEDDFARFCACLRELTSVFEGYSASFTRQPKTHGHHEIEFFGLPRGVALERLVPQLELLMEQITLRRTNAKGAAVRIAETDALYRSLLTRPEFADETCKAFTETLYMYITGEIYSLMGEGSTPAFDDRRTALPGATFVDGRPVYHPGTDTRSEVLLSNLRAMMSKDERVEYANVYELRTDDNDQRPIGEGLTREVVYKTNLRPIVASLVEKRLALIGRRYGGYVFARIQALKALGVALSEYRLLRRRAHGRYRSYDYYIRTRCEGEPLPDIPAGNFLSTVPGGGEDPQVVAALAFLMGDAAAQNLAMKKYDAATKSCLYDIGKEIYRFGYDIKAGRLMPQAVSCCSVRGSFGWPDISMTDANAAAIMRFYVPAYAAALDRFAAHHPSVPRQELAERFLDGFDFRSRSMDWQLTVRRDAFESFSPRLMPRYRFAEKWRFVLWALSGRMRHLGDIKSMFMECLSSQRTEADS